MRTAGDAYGLGRDTPSPVSVSAFSNCNRLRAIYVPSESVETYRQAPGWSDFAERIQPPPSPGSPDNPWRIGTPIAKDVLAYIDGSTLFIDGKGAMTDFGSATDTPWYERRTKFSKVELGSGLTRLGDHAFAGCLGIVEVTSTTMDPPSGGTGAFAAVPSDCTWVMPLGAAAAYARANEAFSWGYQGGFVEYYSVDVAPAAHGKVSVNWPTRLFGGEEIRVTAIPDRHYHLASLVYFDGEEHDITATMRFTMPDTNVTVTAVFESAAQGSPLNPWEIGKSDAGKVLAYTNDINSLVIEGTGATKDFSLAYVDLVPWQEFRDSLTSIVVGPDVSRLGINIFNGTINVSRIVLKSPVVIDAGVAAFELRDYQCVAYVPNGLKAGYEEKCEAQSWQFSGKFAEYYEVKVLPSENGRVAVDKPFVLTTDEKTVTATAYPAENCRLASLVYFDGEEHDITATMRFTMPAKNVTVTAVFAELVTRGYPWTVSDGVTAYSDGDGTLVIEGTGPITSAPWKAKARGFTAMQIAEGVTDFGESLSTLPNLRLINGLALTTFSTAAVGAARAAGITAFAVDPAMGAANLRFTVKTAPSVRTERKDWKTAAEVPVTVKAEGPAGFFVIEP